MFDEISLSGEKAIKLLMSDGFPSDNRFGLRFYDGNEVGEDEAITSFDDGYICTPTRRYPFSWLRKPDAELIITEKSAELEIFLASLSTPFENRMNSINVRLQAIGFPIAVNTTTLEDREFVLRLLVLGTWPALRCMGHHRSRECGSCVCVCMRMHSC